MKRIGIAIVIVLSVSLVVICLAGWRVQAYRDGQVSAGEIVTPVNFISPHADVTHYLTVFGRTYRGVQGMKPFYLAIPDLNSILFVTGDGDQVFHLVNLGTKRERHITAEKSGFGGHIGSARAAGEPYTDFVVSATTNRVVVASEYPDAKKSLYLDFGAGKIQQVVYEKYMDQVTNRTTYVDGRRVN